MKSLSVLILIGLNVLAFFAQTPLGDDMIIRFALWPLQEIEGQSLFRPWQLLSHAFLHGSAGHLIFNMLGLWMFGREIESIEGSPRFLLLYFASVATAAVAQLFIPNWLGATPAPTLGASGGVFGLLLAYAVYFPKRKIVPLFPPIPMPAWVFATGYAAIELYMGVMGTKSGIAHFAHLGGMVGSAIILARWGRLSGVDRGKF
jgi:membrane associated rhomboid family serine protease